MSFKIRIKSNSNLYLNIVFLPPYSSILDPIELFKSKKIIKLMIDNK